MQILIEVDVPDQVRGREHLDGLTRHVKAKADLAVKEFMENEVDPKGCWCTGLDHRQDCHNWVLPY